MIKYITSPGIIILIFILTVNFSGCTKDNEEQKPSDIWDIDLNGIPDFVGTNYIELDKIYRISKFRSSVGHDYSDAFEQCRSMKHYFEPRGDIDWASVKIFCPVTGTITRVEEEWAGTKIEIASDDYPAFRFSFFHINPSEQRYIGDKVVAGEQLGMHIGSQTMSDISVIVNDPTRQGRMVSYFDVMTDALFNEYASHGITSRENMIIPKTTRDANPLTCNGDSFITTDTLENWAILN
jgi:hypothetical protein